MDRLWKVKREFLYGIGEFGVGKGGWCKVILEMNRVGIQKEHAKAPNPIVKRPAAVAKRFHGAASFFRQFLCPVQTKPYTRCPLHSCYVVEDDL